MYFIFQSGEFYNQPTLNFFKDYLPALGIIVTITIFIIQNSREARKKRKEKENTFNYFVALLNSVIKIADAWALKFTELSVNLTTKPFEYNRLIEIADGDLHRILHDLKHETIFTVYLGMFKNNEERVTRFKNVFGRLDVIEGIKIKVIEFDESLRTELLTEKRKYKEITENLIDYCYAFTTNLFSGLLDDTRELRVAVKDVLENYETSRPEELTPEYIQSGFIEPLKERMRPFLNTEKGTYIGMKAKSATWIFNGIKKTNSLAAEQLTQQSENIKKFNLELAQFANDIDYTFAKKSLKEKFFPFLLKSRSNSAFFYAG
jgi:hypothetical protein